MIKKRVVEVIDSNGVVRYYPEQKGLLWGWNRVNMYEGHDYLSFDTFTEAEKWICYEHTKEVNIMEVNCE